MSDKLPDTEKPILLIPSLRAGGGAERQVEILFNHGVFSEIVTLENINEFDIDGNQVTALTDYGRQQSRLFHTLYIPIYAWKLSRYLKNRPNPIIFSTLERANFVNIVSRLFFRHKIITNTQVHAFTLYTSLIEKSNILLMWLLYRFADLVSANSGVTLHDMCVKLKLDPSKGHVLPNFYDTDSIKAKAAENLPMPLENLFTHRSLVSTGRITAQKCHWHTLKIFATVKEKHPDVKLLVLNDGDLRDQAIDYSRRLGLRTWSIFDPDSNLDSLDDSHDVYFIGIQKNPYTFFRKATLSIHPSACEGLPNALIEARISGAVCVASDCPSGPREIIAPDSKLDAIATGIETTEEGVLLEPFSGTATRWSLGELDSAETAWVEALDHALGDAEWVSRTRQTSERTIARYDIEHLQQHLGFLTTDSTD